MHVYVQLLVERKQCHRVRRKALTRARFHFAEVMQTTTPQTVMCKARMSALALLGVQKTQRVSVKHRDRESIAISPGADCRFQRRAVTMLIYRA